MSERNFFNAANAGNEAEVARLLAAQPTLLCEEEGLDLAASKGYDKVVAQMLATDVGVQIDISSALYEAAIRGHSKVVDVLLTARNPNFTLDNSGYIGQALCHLVERGDQSGFTQLLPVFLGSEMTNNGVYLLHKAAECGRDNMMAQILALRPDLIHGVLNGGWCSGQNVLMSAVEHGHQTTAEILLAIKPELIFHVSNNGYTVLHYAVKSCENAEFVAKLWRMNPHALTHTNTNSKTPFHLAIESLKNELIEWFQWSLSFDDIVSAFTLHKIDYQERYRPVMEHSCESLFVSLNRDVAGTVLEYVGIDIVKRENKHKLMPQTHKSS